MDTNEINPQDKSYSKIATMADHVRYEFTNQDTVVLRKSGNYFKAVGNSAVILKLLGAKTKVRSLYNQTFQQEVIEMSLHKNTIQETKEYLLKQSIKLLRDDDTFFIVRLRHPFSAKHIKAARNSATVRTEITEHILTAGRSNTPLAREVREIFKEVAQLVRNMKNQDGVALGYTLLQETLDLQKAVRQLTRTENPSKELL